MSEIMQDFKDVEKSSIKESSEEPKVKYVDPIWARVLRWFDLWTRLLKIWVVINFRYIQPSDPESMRLQREPTNFSSLLNCSLPHGDWCWNATIPEQSIRYAIGERYRVEKSWIHISPTAKTLALDQESGVKVTLNGFIGSSANYCPLPRLLSEAFDYNIDSWPTEIPAALLITQHLHSGKNASNTTSTAFLPLLDYFLLCQDRKCSAPKWYHVTPLLSSGTLNSFANTLRKSTSLSYRALDTRFRPALRTLIRSLVWLHDHGLCHDAISPEALHVHSEIGTEQVTWYLGSFSHVREHGHPFHHSRLWVEQEQWADCRLNDVRFALKTYLSFIRAASNDTSAFDNELWEGREPWSRLYWRFLRNPVSAREVLMVEDEEEPENAVRVNSEYYGKEPGYVTLGLMFGYPYVKGKAARLEVGDGLSGAFVRPATLRWKRTLFAPWWIEAVSVTGENSRLNGCRIGNGSVALSG